MRPPTKPNSLWTGLLTLTLAQWPSSAAAESLTIADIGRAANDSLLWGPYKPNLYFGVRPRIPKSLTGGLLWTRVEDYQSVQTSEYCSQQT